MNIISEIDPFVKRQIHYHERQAYRLRGDPDKAKLHTDYIQQFNTILDTLSEVATLKKEIEELKSRPSPVSPITEQIVDKTIITAADLAGLPPELIAQLNIPEQDDQEKLILSIIAENYGVISLDKLLIGLWRKTQTVPQKKYITTKLYRMIGKNLIYKVPSKRGLYTTDPIPNSTKDEQDEGEEA